MFNITQFRECIVAPVLQALNIRSKAFEELLVFTCAVESAGGTYVKQVNGPALGIYQIEPGPLNELWTTYILRKPDIVNLFSLHFNVNRLPAPEDIISNLFLATATCVFYYQWKKVNPNDFVDATEEHLWEIYKQYYNTPAGKAEKDNAIKAYRKFIKA